MGEQLTEADFEALTRKAVQRGRQEDVSVIVEGSRRRNPFELQVFRRLPQEKVFTKPEWADWSRLILRAIDAKGEDGLRRENEESLLLLKMLDQLKAAGSVQLLPTPWRYVITPAGKALLQEAEEPPP